MLNETMDGIARQLEALFGDGYAVYIDESGERLTPPCFFIVCTASSQQQEIGAAYTRRQAFDIRCFPKAQEAVREVNSVLETLNLGLEYITVAGNLVRGTNLRHEVIDGVLHFLVNYDIRIRKVIEPDPLMEELELNEEVKTSGD